MARHATLTSDDMALCVSALMMSARLGHEKLTGDAATALQCKVNAIAGNLHAGAINEEDVQNICTSLEAMCTLLSRDTALPKQQRHAVQYQARLVQQKLQRGNVG